MATLKLLGPRTLRLAWKEAAPLGTQIASVCPFRGARRLLHVVASRPLSAREPALTIGPDARRRGEPELADTADEGSLMSSDM